MKYQIRHSYLTLFIDSPISIIDLFQQFHLSKKTIHLMKQNHTLSTIVMFHLQQY